MELRNACFSAVGQFELLLRNSISEALSHKYGSYPYFNVDAFKDPTKQLASIEQLVKTFKHSKDQRAHHYKGTYTTPLLPPIWTMKELLTFGASVKLLQSLSGSVQKTVAEEFGVSSYPVFESWIVGLVDLRNICAHHDRLFNRAFQKQPQKFRNAAVPSARINSLKALLECLDYMFKHKGMKVRVTITVNKIIKRYPMVSPAEVGY